MINLRIKFWQLWQYIVIKNFKHEREPYRIGYTSLSINNLNDNLSESVEDKLIELGYSPNYFSYADNGQITSMRKIVTIIEQNPQSNYYNQRIWKQYHIRIFNDHEVRGHYELTYEEDAKAHVNAVEMSPLPEDELKSIIKTLNIYEE